MEKESHKENRPSITKTNKVQNQNNGKDSSPRSIFKTNRPPPPSSRPKFSQSLLRHTSVPDSIFKTNKTSTAQLHQQNEEKFEKMQESKDMKELIDMFKGKKDEANNFLLNFDGSASDALVFIKKFENVKLAEGWLIKITEECDEKTDNSCGDNCKWIFDEKTKTLFIRGSGKMKEYGWDSSKKAPTTPWSSKREQIENVVISEGITTIGQRALHSCSLISITIPNGVTTIGRWAFSCCSSLTFITIPNSVTIIGEGTFSSCSSLTSITIPNSVTTIGEGAFYNCSSFLSVTMPKKFESSKNTIFRGTPYLQKSSGRSTTKQCRGLYAFNAVQPGDLSFKAGDIITIVEKTEKDWWEGELNGVRGQMPSNYVQEL